MSFLFERLAAEPGVAFDLAAAVAEQVERIVTARPFDDRLDAPGLLSFGMPSVVEMAAGDTRELGAYAARLERMLAHYEPRLLQPSVSLEALEGRLAPFRLLVTGALTPGGEPQRFSFDLLED